MADAAPVQGGYPSTEKIVQAALDHVRRICRGNGVKVDAVQVKSHQVSIHTVNAATYIELKPALAERTAQGKSVAGQLVGSREEAMRQLDQIMIHAARDAVQKARIADTLFKRSDKGFGLAKEPIPLDFLKREFTWHEGCQTCRGRGQGACPKCHGRKVETCGKCTGRGLMMCPLCRGSGMVNGARCTRCNAQRFVPCDVCRRSGHMPCRQCQGSGASKCASCGGAGWKSHILVMQPHAIPYFEYEAKSIPQAAADMFETGAAGMAASKKVDIQGRTTERENSLGAAYEVRFPFGDIVFAIGQKEIKAKLFGYAADLPGFPYILDKMLAAPIRELEEAAQDHGSVADTIQKASRYRAIGMAFVNAPRIGPAKTLGALLKAYDIGLSHAAAGKIAKLAEQTTGQITRKPRIHGFLGGIAAAVLVNALYYLTPLRGTVGAMMPDPRLDGILDVIMPVVGGLLINVCIRYNAGRAIRRAFVKLNAGIKDTALPLAGVLGRWAYGAAIIVTLGMIEISVMMGKAAPYWHGLIRSFISG